VKKRLEVNQKMVYIDRALQIGKFKEQAGVEMKSVETSLSASEVRAIMSI